MENINIQYPVWFLLLVLITGAAYAYFLYWREKAFLDKPGWVRIFLFILRASAIALISFFLLEPFFKNNNEEEKKPILIIAQDQTASLPAIQDPASLASLTEQMQSLSESLSDKYDVRDLHFGQKIGYGLQDTFADKTTNISSLFSFINDQYYGLPVAGTIVASDGIFNEGQNPIYQKNITQSPIWTIALGDTIPRLDMSIRNVYHNNIVFLGDRVPIRFDVHAYGYKGENPKVSIYDMSGTSRRLIDQKNIQIESNDFFHSGTFLADASKTGTQHFKMVLDAFDNEISRSNNSKDIFIDVIDSKTKVFIIAASPHPDVSAIKQSLTNNKNYEVSFSLLQDLNDVGNPDVIVFHNLPVKTQKSQSLIKQIRQKNIPHFFILGQQSELSGINSVQDIVTIQAALNSSNETQAIYNKNFNSFQMDQELVSDILQFPPLTVPFGTYTEASDSKVLLYQKIGNIETTYPLIAFNDRNGLKTGILTGEGLWKWRLNNFAKKDEHTSFDQLLTKTIQYLSIKDDKRKWQVMLDKNVWNENEKVQFTATFFNDSYEAYNSPEARITLTHESGNKYEMVFTREDNYYSLDAGYLPVGKYRYKAIINSGNGEEYSGAFVVRELQLELVDLQARHDILYQMSEMSGGKMYFQDQIQQLEEDLSKMEVKPVIFNTETYRNLINLKSLFFLILLLISVEWFIRRFNGAY